MRKIQSLLSLTLLTWSSHGFAAAVEASEKVTTFDLFKVFQSCPIIYSLLLAMSLTSLVIWIYSLMTLRMNEMMPPDFMTQLRGLLMDKQYEAAMELCGQEKSFASTILHSGIAARKHGPQMMMDSMSAEGRRKGNSLWQRIALLNEIAVIAPMLGLLGTVLGLFLAFYENDRTAESIASIFDGLGIAIGTTVVGLIVSILAMIFYTTLKFRVVNLLNSVENETLDLATIIEPTKEPL